MRNTDFKKYLILSTPRAGSTLLSRMVLNHPNVIGKGEYFDRLRGREPSGELETLFRPQRKSIKAVGFNIHYNHPADEKKKEAWSLLKECKDLHIIHLSRKNTLRYYVSSKIARKLTLFNIKEANDRPDLEKRRVIVTPQELRVIINSSSKRYQSYHSMFSSHPIIEVEFERLILNPETEFLKLTKFLGLDHQKPKISTVIMNPEPLSELIINYDELKHEFISSPCSWMFY